MRTGSAWTRGRLAIGAMLAAAIIIGFAAETASLFDEFWLAVVAAFTLLALLLTAALAVRMGESVSLAAAVVSGVMAGYVTGAMFVLGTFFPFALELGGRDLNEVGGDAGWLAVLIVGVPIYGGGGGAALGAVCGTAAWALWMGLGRRSSDRQPDATEAGR